jgi:hypothetical protein
VYRPQRCAGRSPACHWLRDLAIHGVVEPARDRVGGAPTRSAGGRDDDDAGRGKGERRRNRAIGKSGEVSAGLAAFGGCLIRAEAGVAGWTSAAPVGGILTGSLYVRQM